MSDLSEPEQETQREIEEQGAGAPDDPTTSREEVELELMDEERSDDGEEIGDQMG